MTFAENIVTMKIASGFVLLWLFSSVLAAPIQVQRRRRLDDEESADVEEEDEAPSSDGIDEVKERECELGE